MTAYLHGAHLVLLDGLGLGVGLPPASVAPLRDQCCAFLRQQLPTDDSQAPLIAASAEGDTSAAATLGASAAAEAAGDSVGRRAVSTGRWGIHPFYVTPTAPPASAPAEPPAVENGSGTDGVGNEAGGAVTRDATEDTAERAAPGVSFELSAPTAARNAYRVLRALTLKKAVLLEGSPGVGKTALVAALARRAGVPLVSVLVTPTHTHTQYTQRHTHTHTHVQCCLAIQVWVLYMLRCR